MTTAEAKEILEAADLPDEVKQKLLDKVEKHGLTPDVQTAISKAIDIAVRAIEHDLAKMADLEVDTPDNVMEVSMAKKMMDAAFEKYENEVDQIEHAVQQTTTSGAKKKDAAQIKKLKKTLQQD